MGSPTEEHFFVEPEIIRPRAADGTRRRLGAKKSRSSYRAMRDEASHVYAATLQKGKIVLDPNMYFVITFSDSLRSPIIQNVIERLGVDVVAVSSETVAKVRIPKNRYEFFLQHLARTSNYIEHITESALEEKIETLLLQQIEQAPEKLVRVNIEISRLGDGARSETIVEKLLEYVHSQNVGKMEKAYTSPQFFLLTGELPARFVREIAEDLDAITRINLARAVKLRGGGLFSTSLDEGRASKVRVRSLRSAPKVESSMVANLPALCILDSGINQNHDLIKPYLQETYDLVSDSNGPCTDEVGHGSLVAGMAIYQGDVQAAQASSKVIAVKMFSEAGFDGNVMAPIIKTVQKFRTETRVFNLSFSMDGPDPGVSRALDDLAFREKILFVVCAGNIDPDKIITEIRRGNSYPQYLTNYPVYFPGDCFNVLTVGSFADKDSNFVQKQHPSPFTRTYALGTKVKPEVLASGGNLNVESQAGQVTSCNSNLCGILSTSSVDNDIIEDAGTSFSCPVVSSIAAGLAAKFPNNSGALLKALIASSCDQLTDSGNRPFDAAIQGFGVPSQRYSSFSTFWRVNLCSDSTFDLRTRKQLHRYKFPFPDNADILRLTLCFEVEPVLGAQLPYEIMLRLRKPGVRRTTWARPDKEIPGGESNVKVYEFKVRRGGRGIWTLDLYHRLKPGVPVAELSEKFLRYALVISVISNRRLEVYNSIRAFLRRAKSATV